MLRRNGFQCNRQWNGGRVRISDVGRSSQEEVPWSYSESWRVPAAAVPDKEGGEWRWLVSQTEWEWLTGRSTAQGDIYSRCLFLCPVPDALESLSNANNATIFKSISLAASFLCRYCTARCSYVVVCWLVAWMHCCEISRQMKLPHGQHHVVLNGGGKPLQ